MARLPDGGGAAARARLSAALGAALFGVFVVRLSGIYLAMLTLAAAQILYAVAFQWVASPAATTASSASGRRPGRRVRRPITDLTLALVAVAAVAGLRHVIVRALRLRLAGGARLRAARRRDRPRRARAPLARLRARRRRGGARRRPLRLLARARSTRALLGIPTSVDALIMLLLGGLHTVDGAARRRRRPARAQATRSCRSTPHFWRLDPGRSSIIAMVLLFPQGLVGASRGSGAVQARPPRERAHDPAARRRTCTKPSAA